MTEWISTKERMPDKTGDYFVIWDTGKVAILLFNSENYLYTTWYSMRNKFLYFDQKGDFHPTDRIAYWMPIPEVPEEFKDKECEE